MEGPLLWSCIMATMLDTHSVRIDTSTPGFPVMWHSPHTPCCACAGVTLLIIAVVIPTAPRAAMVIATNIVRTPSLQSSMNIRLIGRLRH
jgi:hypothetical protein